MALVASLESGILWLLHVLLIKDCPESCLVQDIFHFLWAVKIREYSLTVMIGMIKKKKKVSCNEIQTCWRELMNSCFLEVTPCLWFRLESRALGMRSDGIPRLLFTIHYKSWPSESRSLSVYILGTLVLQNWKKARNKVCMSDLLVSSQIFLFFYPVFSTSFSNHLVSIPRGSYYFF